MNFDIYKTDTRLNVKKIAKKSSSFWIRRNPKTDIELFHLNLISAKLAHAVFFITDEYQLGTKKSGSQVSIPFNQYVNTFIFPEKGYIFVELIHKEYNTLVLNEYEKIFTAKFSPYILNNYELENIYTSLEATITEIEYKDEFDDIYYLESENEVKQNLPELFSEKNNIEFLLFNVKNNFVSIRNKEIIAIGNDDDDFLINMCEDVIDALD